MQSGAVTITTAECHRQANKHQDYIIKRKIMTLWTKEQAEFDRDHAVFLKRFNLNEKHVAEVISYTVGYIQFVAAVRN